MSLSKDKKCYTVTDAAIHRLRCTFYCIQILFVKGDGFFVKSSF